VERSAAPGAISLRLAELGSCARALAGERETLEGGELAAWRSRMDAWRQGAVAALLEAFEAEAAFEFIRASHAAGRHGDRDAEVRSLRDAAELLAVLNSTLD